MVAPAGAARAAERERQPGQHPGSALPGSGGDGAHGGHGGGGGGGQGGRLRGYRVASRGERYVRRYVQRWNPQELPEKWAASRHRPRRFATGPMGRAGWLVPSVTCARARQRQTAELVLQKPVDIQLEDPIQDCNNDAALPIEKPLAWYLVHKVAHRWRTYAR